MCRYETELYDGFVGGVAELTILDLVSAHSGHNFFLLFFKRNTYVNLLLYSSSNEPSCSPSTVVEIQDHFNSFQFWREPILEFDDQDLPTVDANVTKTDDEVSNPMRSRIPKPMSMALQ